MIRATVYGVPLIVHGMGQVKGHREARKDGGSRSVNARWKVGLHVANATRSRTRTQDAGRGGGQERTGARYDLPSLSFQGGAK